ncbi:DUF2752 domain-containing protein [Streptomyces sp. NPDC008317]|uniref:DUF2752 domain-containing protein n=1 Tax=Streptomyces sp. NPDC008317 TaxID=3364827 RepID=UPI0036EEEE3C
MADGVRRPQVGAPPVSPGARRPSAVLGHPATAPLATLAAGVAGAVYLYGTDPHQPGHWLPRCPFNWATGLLCPACGGTRMVYDLMHGDVGRAFHDNGVLLLAAPLALWLCGRWMVEGLRGRRRRLVVSPRVSLAVLCVAVTWTVVRNVF